MKTVTRVSLLGVMALVALAAGIWACFAVNRWVGYGADWKFLGAVLLPSACWCVALWCAGTAWRLVYEARRRELLMRVAAAAGYPPKEITDYFK
jgi:hypothetical protein